MLECDVRVIAGPQAVARDARLRCCQLHTPFCLCFNNLDAAGWKWLQIITRCIKFGGEAPRVLLQNLMMCQGNETLEFLLSFGDLAHADGEHAL